MINIFDKYFLSHFVLDDRKTFLFLILTSFVYYLFISHFPTSLHADAWIDDAYGSNIAFSFLKGKWLGDYGSYTLVKGPGFGFFILLCFIAGISIIQGIGLMNIFSLFLLVKALQKIKVNNFVLILIFVSLLFHPAIIPTRPMRDFLCPSLLYIFLTAIISFLYIDKKRLNAKYILFGIFFGFLLIVRDDWHWLYPSIFIIFFLMFRYKNSLKINLTNIFYMFFSTIIFLLIIGSLNFINYGKLIINDFKESNYSRALKLIDLVDDGDYKPFLMASSKKRDLIAKNSPSFNKISNYFDNEGRGWKDHGCNFYEWTCGDISTGWFFWALRDAVALHGFYSSPTNASNFYKKLGDEIEEACLNHKLVCRTKFIPLFPYFSYEHFINHSKRYLFTIFELISMSNHRLDIKPTPSTGEQKRFDKFVRINGNPYFVPRQDSSEISLSGWAVTAKVKLESIEIICKLDQQDLIYKPYMLDSPDVASYFKDYSYNKNRFKINFKEHDSCEFKINNRFFIPLRLFNEKKLHYRDNNLELNLDKFDLNSGNNKYVKRFYKLREKLANLYSIFIPSLFLIAFILYLHQSISTLLNKENFLKKPIYIVASLTLILLLSRLLMIYLVDLTMFPALNSLYLSCAYVLIVIFSFLSIDSFIKKSKIKKYIN